MTLHLLGLPHTRTTSEFASCAYTQRVIKLCRMLHGRDRPLVLYGSEINEAPCDEHVTIVSEAQREAWFGPVNENDLGRGGFDWLHTSEWWRHANQNAVNAIRERMDDKDLLLVTAGQTQQPVADLLPQLTVAEPMVGYKGIITSRQGGPAFAAFESYAHQHFVYGWLNMEFPGRYGYDVVIPNQFDPAEFTFRPDHDGYLLFVGRLILHKGPQIAAQIAQALDMPLKVAGPGALRSGDGWVEAAEVRVEPCEYVGTVGIEQRAELMAGAACLLAPTTYLEPFGGVAVEAMMSGCPVVTFDTGAFTETVVPGVSGYRFHTLQEGVDATSKSLDIPRAVVREHAMRNYSLDAVRPRYQQWFDNLDGLWGEGWTALTDHPLTMQA
ncbi:MAG: glycosyltransferase [Candidatus Krumholzibacteria bacterium]|nr:glycosyltransferase [Candidatus Krumholzibacteria bacterium]